MKATTLTGIPARARRLLTALRDKRPYMLPRGVVHGSPQALAHVTALARILGTAGLIESTGTDAEGHLLIALTEKGVRAAENL